MLFTEVEHEHYEDPSVKTPNTTAPIKSSTIYFAITGYIYRFGMEAECSIHHSQGANSNVVNIQHAGVIYTRILYAGVTYTRIDPVTHNLLSTVSAEDA